MSVPSSPKVDNSRVEAALAAFGNYGDPLTVLAESVTKHTQGQISDMAVGAYAVLWKWARKLGRPELYEFARYIQQQAGFASDPKPSIEMGKAISLYEFLKGVNIMGSGK